MSAVLDGSNNGEKGSEIVVNNRANPPKNAILEHYWIEWRLLTVTFMERFIGRLTGEMNSNLLLWKILQGSFLNKNILIKIQRVSMVNIQSHQNIHKLQLLQFYALIQYNPQTDSCWAYLVIRYHVVLQIVVQCRIDHIASHKQGSAGSCFCMSCVVLQLNFP